MGRIIVTEWVTLDGFVSEPDGGMAFVGESFDDEMGKYEADIVKGADTLILGRVTYQSFAGSWPYVPDKPDVDPGEKEYALRLNAMKKIVFSRTLPSADWANSQLLRDIDPEFMGRMKQEEPADMLIYGSTSIVQEFTNMGLIDEYQLLVHPVLVGDGKPLFKSIKDRRKLTCVSAQPFASGVVLMTYTL